VYSYTSSTQFSVNWYCRPYKFNSLKCICEGAIDWTVIFRICGLCCVLTVRQIIFYFKSLDLPLPDLIWWTLFLSAKENWWTEVTLKLTMWCHWCGHSEERDIWCLGTLSGSGACKFGPQTKPSHAANQVIYLLTLSCHSCTQKM